MKIGLYFGSFNPIHVGHLIIAETLLNETDLDQIWLVVSPQNPFKDKKSLLNENERYKMVELATQNHTKLIPSNVEFILPKPSFTIDTLTYLSANYKNYQFSIIMGEDNLVGLHKWKNYEAILEHYKIYVYPRKNEEIITIEHPSIQRFIAPNFDISSTKIRELIKQGKSVRYLVTDSVYEYLKETNSYGN